VAISRLVIFHTSDMHGALTAPRAARLAETFAQEADYLYFDSGDAVSFGNLDIRPWDMTISRLNALGCAAMAMGNREFHPWATLCRWKTAAATFPVLGANVTLLGRPVPWLQPSTVLTTASGLRVGVFGLTLPIVISGTWHEWVSRFRFEPPIQAAKRLAAKLRPQCDLLIALTHTGLSADREIARNVAGIDLILGGHGHIETNPLERHGRTVICHSKDLARYASRLEVDIAADGEVEISRDVVELR